MFVVTDAWLRQHSRDGGWTRDQFAALGLPWMPPKGWKWTIINTTITDDQRARFERAMRAKQATAADATLDLFR
jgi:hypothetical protein